MQQSRYPQFINRALSISSMLVVLSALTAWVSMPGSIAQASDYVYPAPRLSPDEVVELQLSALGRVDAGRFDDGVRQVWLLAHPDNRRFVGSLPRFAAMLSMPGYSGLLGHRSHQVVAAHATDQRIEYYVTVRARQGDTQAFLWVVEKVSGGEYDGCWMTRAVSPATRLNRSA